MINTVTQEGLLFYLGSHRPQWLWQVPDIPLFVSHRRLRDRKSPYPKAITRWALDSGGFTELSLYGKWVTTPQEYIDAVRRYQEELGSLDWASPQDWMCEPVMLAKTGLSVTDHQERTVENYLILRELAPDLPFIPVLQGWELPDYLKHLEMYSRAGLDLTQFPTVGVGSVCRRQHTAEIGQVFSSLAAQGLSMHGFGVKTQGLSTYGHYLISSDSMAWSFGGRRAGKQPGCDKKNCANCLHYALDWRDRVLAKTRSKYIDN